MPNSVEEFLSRLSESGLLSADELAAIDRSLELEGVVDSLMKQGRITSFQAEVLSTGKDSPLVLGDYVILEKIGEGGMGQVFLARHRRMKRDVALKILPSELTNNEDAIKRFQREVEAAAKLLHPNIVSAFDAGEDSDTHYLITEYVEGTDLSALVKESGLLSVEDAVDFVRQAATGLSYAHAEGVIHRDIKPSNLLLDKKGTIKVLDMGLARFETAAGGEEDATQAELTGTGTIMGTVDYMSPEQALDTKHADARSDIYSLGCTLYYLLTGKPVFTGDSLMKKLLAHREAAIPALTEVRPEVPAELESIYQKMVAKRPEDRYQSMAALVEELTPFISVEDSAVGIRGAAGKLALQQAEAGVATTLKQVKADPKAPASSETLASSVENPTLVTDSKVRAAKSKLKRRKWLVTAGIVGLVSVAIIVIIPMLQAPSLSTITLTFDQPEIAGAEVMLDGKKIMTVLANRNEELIEVAVDDQEHLIEVTKAGFEKFAHRFNANRDDSKPVPVWLKPLQKRQSRDVVATKQWEPGPAVDVLPGIVPRPAVLPGIRRWQVETRLPRTSLKSIAWSPDGKLMAIGTAAGTVRIYDANEFQLVRILVGHRDAVLDLAWSPDGQYFASSGDDGDRTVRIWNTDGSIHLVLRGHRGRVYSIAWSPDSKQLATGSADRTVGIWNIDGSPRSVIRGHGYQVYAVAWEPNGKWIASADVDKVRLSRPDGTPGPVLEHGSEVWALAWTGDGSKLASGGENGKVWLWNSDGSKDVELKGPSGRVSSLKFSPDGTMLAGEGDTSAKIWTIGEEKSQVLKPKHDKIAGLAWSPDGSRLASAQSYGKEGDVKLWRMDGSGETALRGHQSTVKSLAWNPKTAQLASGIFDGTVRVWNVDGRQESSDRRHSYWVGSIVWSPDGDRLASGGGDRRICISGPNDTSDTVINARGMVVSVTWHPGGQIVASGDDDGTIRFWDSNVGRQLEVLQGHTTNVNDLAWTPDGMLLASASDDKTIRLWDQSGKPMVTIEEHTRTVDSVAWRPGGNQLLSGSNDGTVRFWERDGTASSTPATLKALGYVLSCRWSPDGKRIAIGESSRNISLWYADGTRSHELAGHQGSDKDVAWISNGKLLASGSSDATIRTWSTDSGEPHWVAVVLSGGKAVTFSSAGQILHASPEAEQELVYLVEREQGKLEMLSPAEFAELTPPVADTRPGVKSLELSGTLSGHTSTVTAIDVSADGRLAVSGSQHDKAVLWDLQTGKTLHVFEFGYYVDISPDGRFVALSSRGSTNVVINSLETYARDCVLKGPGPGIIRGLSFSPDGRFLLGTSNDGTAHYWNVTGRKIVHSFPLGVEFRFGCTTLISGDGKIGVVCPHGQSPPIVLLLDLQMGKVQRRLEVEGGGSSMGYLAVSSDAKTILVPQRFDDGGGKLAVCDLATGKAKRFLETGAYGVAFLPDDRHAVCDGEDGAVSVWDTQTGRLVAVSSPHKRKYPVKSLAVTPDGNTILAGHGPDYTKPTVDSDTLEEDFAVRLWRLP